MKKFYVFYTDPDTGATSQIDTIEARENYNAKDYIRDCEGNGVTWGTGEITLETAD